MNYFYGMSLIGTSHVSKGGVCQDSHRIKQLENNVIIAAVADGVGSSKHSDIASSIAVNTVVDYCENKIKSFSNEKSLEDVKTVIYEAYCQAQLNIEKESLESNNIITDYDTTLSMVIFDGKHIFYGHSGDGGIIGLTKSGEYKKITIPQKNEGIYVIPLRAGATSWEIGYCEEEFASILIATDGVYDAFFPYLLKGQDVEIYIPLIRYFMDNNILLFSEETKETIQESREKFFTSEACASITDDKTIVVIVNGDVFPEFKEHSYYVEPNWDELQNEWNKKAYPHLYSDKK